MISQKLIAHDNFFIYSKRQHAGTTLEYETCNKHASILVQGTHYMAQGNSFEY